MTMLLCLLLCDAPKEHATSKFYDSGVLPLLLRLAMRLGARSIDAVSDDDRCAKVSSVTPYSRGVVATVDGDTAPAIPPRRLVRSLNKQAR
ncbi:hypothetical protein ASF32_14620 [Methylobacterium sp. Leaf91]|nr:hypothetical protein ASF32_14620 [Methylobacterium sp. Leaf91]